MQNIKASVGLGGRNFFDDARVVQTLLNRVIAELMLPWLLVDGIVGPKTIGAIRAFQQRRFGKSDGRVDPNGPTIMALNQTEPPAAARRVRCGAGELGGKAGVVTSAAGFMPVSYGFAGGWIPSPFVTPKEDALANRGETLRWLSKALTALQTVRSLMQSGQNSDLQKLEGMVEYHAVNTHFHLDRHPNPLKFLSDLGKNFTLMSIAVAGADTNFENDFASDDYANADPGGFYRRDSKDSPGRMYFCRNYIQTGPLTHVVTIIHEAAHYIDTNIDHFASGVPAPQGRPLNGTNGQSRSRNYAQLLPDEAILNASSYAGFAINVAKGHDIRPVISQ